MKYYKLLAVFIFVFAHTATQAQEPQNFYSIKSYWDNYYDSLLLVYGLDSMQGSGYNPYKRWVDYWEPKIYPHGDFSTERQKLEQYVADFLNGDAAQNNAPFTLDWDLIGPDKMPEGSSSAYKGLGQIHYIAFDPNDATCQKMFACSPAGGLWRSLDGGNNWFNAGTDKGLPLCGVSSIAIDPENSDTHWFVSTGNGDPMPGKSWAQNSIGIGRTTDGGVNWDIIGLENAWQMRKVILTRFQGKVELLVATTGGLYECEDALATNPQFIKREDGNFYDVEFDPQHIGIAYASGTGPNSSVYKIDWINNMSTELPYLSSIPVEDGRRLILEISEAAPQYLFIVATYLGGSNTSYLYRYNLSNGNILPKGVLPAPNLNPQGIGPERAMGWTVSPVLNTNNELIMVHGNTAPIRLTCNLLDNNPYCTWTSVTSGYGTCEIHVDMHYMVFEPDGQTLWVGNDGGVYKSTMPDLQANWQEKNNGLAVATIHHLAVTEDDKEIALSGAYDCGINLYSNINNVWNEKHVIEGDGFQCQFDWDNPDRMWAGTNGFSSGKIFRSENGGQNFDFLTYGFFWHSYFIQNNSFPEILYGTGEAGIRRSTDYGDSWNVYAAYPGVSSNRTWRVTNSYTHGNYVYSSWIGNDDGDPQKVFKSVTGGGTSTSDWEDIGSPLYDKWVSSIVVDYFDPDRIWVSGGGYVYDVNTITHQWNDITNGLPLYIDINHLEILKGAEGVLFAGTSKGLYYYNEDDEIWQLVDGDLPNVDIEDIQIDIANNRIVVGTFGRGVWQASLPCIESSETTSITNDETWHHDRYIIGNLSIESGNTLTLNNSVVRLNKNNKVIVKPGAKLIIDGGKFSNACDEIWQGIEVWGDNGVNGNNPAHQFPDENGDYEQGYLELKNGAIIENAIIGAYIGGRLSTGDSDPDKSGGIIRVIGNNSLTEPSATFLNNEWGIKFTKYKNIHPENGNIMSNASYFHNAYFKVNNDYPGPNYWYIVQAGVYGVQGVQFKGCTFTNQSSVLYGTGIECSTNNVLFPAGFSVSSLCTDQIIPCPESSLDNCIFENFQWGIRALNTGISTLRVEDAIFMNNSKGIEMVNVNNASVLFSDFYIGQPSTDEEEECGERASAYGIYMDNCTGFAIEENYFTKNPGAPTSNFVGIRIANTEAVDEIYKNTFEDLSYANYSEGQNYVFRRLYEGLSFICNDNQSNYADFYVESDPINPSGIQSSQGGTNNAAGNKFSPTGAAWHFYNGGDFIIDYYYCQSHADEYPGAINSDVHRIATSDINYCLSHYGIGGSGEGIERIVLSDDEKILVEQQYYLALTDYNNVNELYTSLEDGGNTENLKTEVETAWPADMWELREELLGKSPHLSQEVLMAAADKTDVLPDAVLFEILSANPDELKKEELLKYLEDKENPLPQYMIDILHQLASGTTYKTILQQQLANHKLSKTRAAHDMIRSIVNDTVVNLDELRNWLDNLSHISADRQIINSYIAENNYADALALAEILPGLYALEGNALDEHNFFMDILNLKITLLQQGRNIADLTVDEITQVNYIAENSRGNSGAEARGILESGHGYNFCDCLNVEDNQGYKSATYNPASINQAYGMALTVEPNPAKDWTAFNYTFPVNANEGVIKISDAKGRLIDVLNVYEPQGQKIWDTRNIKPGVYFYSYDVNGMSESGKIVIIK